MLVENKIIDGKVVVVDKVQVAIERLRAFEPPEGYRLAYSGGKDSAVIKKLAEMAGVKFEARYECTSCDPPELVRFIKAQKDVHWRQKNWSNILKSKDFICERLKKCWKSVGAQA